MTDSTSEHISVMLNESVDMLVTDEAGYYVDGTFGRGGHTRLVLSRLSQGKMLGFDKDPVAISYGRRLKRKTSVLRLYKIVLPTWLITFRMHWGSRRLMGL